MERRKQTSVPNEQHDDEFPEFSLGLRYLRLGAEEASNLKIIRGTYKKNVSGKMSGKGQSSKIESIWLYSTQIP